MQSIRKSYTPPWYLGLCRVIALFGWLPLFFSQPMMHGGTVASQILTWAGLGLGGYCSFELIRSKPWSRSMIFAVAGCILYVMMVGVGLWFATPYIPQLFAT